jgi:hypothetical protein
VPVVVHALHHLLDALLVARVRGADEEVVRGVDARQQVEEALRVAVGELPRRYPLLLRDACDRLAVLVGAGEEEHLLAALAVVAGEDVRADGRVRMPEVRRRVHVVDGRRDVEGHRGRRRLAAGGSRPLPERGRRPGGGRARSSRA